MEDYHSQYNTLKKRVKRLKRDVKSLETKLEVLDECVDRKILVDIIYEIVPSLIGKKGKGFSYLSESFEESNSIKTIVIRENETILHKQRKKAWPKKVKWLGFKVGQARVFWTIDL